MSEQDKNSLDNVNIQEETTKLRRIILENQEIILSKDNFINQQKEIISQGRNELQNLKTQLEKEKEVEIQKLAQQNKLISQSFQSLSVQFQSSQETVRQLTNKVKELNEIHSTHSQSDQDLIEENKQLKLQVDSLKKKTDALRLENIKQKDEYDQLLDAKTIEIARKIRNFQYEIEARDKQITFLQKKNIHSDSSDDDDSNYSSDDSSNNSTPNTTPKHKKGDESVPLRKELQDQIVLSTKQISTIENLKTEISMKEKFISKLESEIEELKVHSIKSTGSVKSNTELLSELKLLETSNTELFSMNQMLRDKMKHLEQEIAISNERLRYYSDDLAAKNATIMQLNRKLKDQILNAKMPPPKSSNNAAIIADLRKELSKVQQSNEALITRGSTLSEEIQLLEKRLALSEKNRIESVKLREEQIENVKTKFMELRSKHYSQVLNTTQQEAINFTEIEEEIETIKRDYFFAVAVGIKLNLNSQGVTSNADLNELYENATKYIPYADWKNWLSKELQKGMSNPRPESSMPMNSNYQNNNNNNKKKMAPSSPSVYSPSGKASLLNLTNSPSAVNQREEDIIEKRYQQQKNNEAMKNNQQQYRRRYDQDDDSSAIISFESMPSGESSEESYF